MKGTTIRREEERVNQRVKELMAKYVAKGGRFDGTEGPGAPQGTIVRAPAAPVAMARVIERPKPAPQAAVVRMPTETRLAAQASQPNSRYEIQVPNAGGFGAVRASQIRPQSVEWLWPGRIPLGCLTIIAGESGAGKSLVTLDLAARVSRGRGWPDDGCVENEMPAEAGTTSAGTPPPANVVILTTHDHPAVTIVPRLVQAGADLDRIVIANGVPRPTFPNVDPCKRQIRLPDDVDALKKLIAENEPVRLVILDPAWAFCTRGPGCSRDAGPAQLAILAELAAEMRVAIVCVTDLRRGSSGDRAYLPVGDRALTSAAPVAWGIVPRPNEEDKRVLVPIKMSLGRKGKKLLEFRISEKGVEWDPAPSKLTLEAVAAADGTWSTEQERAEEMLNAYLANGSRRSKEIFGQAKACGIAEVTLRRAKRSLGVLHRRIGYNGDAHVVWSLPEPPGAAGQDVPSHEMMIKYGK